ncbi:hypothetical protein Tco_0604638 [Tanacetum coccineum]
MGSFGIRKDDVHFTNSFEMRGNHADDVKIQEEYRRGKSDLFLEIVWLVGPQRSKEALQYLQQRLNTLPLPLLFAVTMSSTLDQSTSTYVTISSESKWKIEWLNSTSWKRTINLRTYSQKHYQENVLSCLGSSKEAKEPNLQISVDTLHNKNFFRALTASADVPSSVTETTDTTSTLQPPPPPLQNLGSSIYLEHLKMEMEIPCVKAFANSDIIFFFTSVQEGNRLLDDERSCLDDDLKKAHDQNQNKSK